jgi:hypothetical protein
VNLGRIERQYARITVTATLADGAPADLAGVDVALLPPRSKPTADTTWTAADWADGNATVLLAGPDAAAVAGALTVPAGGADLWVRVTDTPEVDTAVVDRINVS